MDDCKEPPAGEAVELKATVGLWAEEDCKEPPAEDEGVGEGAVGNPSAGPASDCRECCGDVRTQSPDPSYLEADPALKICIQKSEARRE